MKDYLVELLTGYKRHLAKMTLLKNKTDGDVSVDKAQQHYDWLEACVEQLKPENRDTIECLYFKGFSMSQLGRTRALTKSTIQRRKERAIRELRSIFEPIP